MTDRFEHLAETLENLPAEPGVYMMKGETGKILYIGKAKSLRNRVRSYFQESAQHSPRINVMVSKVRSIEVIVTGSEVAALVLEDNLVKKEQPRYNVMLRDDKNYPYLKLTMDEAFPRLVLVRRVENDKGMYFGPYVSSRAVRQTMRLLHRIFPIRQSTDRLEDKQHRRPCLNYQMGRCLAPCAGLTTEEEYRAVVDQVILFLKGHNAELLAELEKKMYDAAEKEEFEQAARYRDQIQYIHAMEERQTISQTNLNDEDIIAAYEEAGRAIIKVFFVRRGKLNGERHFIFDQLERLDRQEAVGAFIRQFYNGKMEIPPMIAVCELPDDEESLSERLSQLRKSKVKIVVPVKGQRKKLLDMAERNAKIQLQTLISSATGKERALEEIRERLNLPAKPVLIEAYDISNTSGLSSVGSIVVFRDGSPSKSDYRKYKIKGVAGPDDYASLAEVVERRVKRLMENGEAFADLMVIDGGKGQLRAVMDRFAELGVTPPPVIGIAKGRDRENPETDEIFIPGAGIPMDFPPASPGKHLLQQARDEAHRFAISFHRKLRSDSMMESSLDNVAGIGPKRKKLLLRHFGSLKRAREATVEELRTVLSVSEKMAKKILEQL